MSEDKGVYQARDKLVRDVDCVCGNRLWQEIIDGDQIYLSVADLIVLHFSGECGGCGRRIEWHCNQVRLDRLVARVLDGRKHDEQAE